MLERRVNTVIGVVQFVVNVLGVLPDVVTLTSGLPGLLSVNVFEPPELATTLCTTTGTGKVIVPTEPLLLR